MIMQDTVILLLIAFIIYREWSYRQDVNKLCDRLMAKNFPEYLMGKKKVSGMDLVSMSDRSEYEAECKKLGVVPEKEEI